MNSSITTQTRHLVAALSTSLLLLSGMHSASAEDAPGTVSRNRGISLTDLDLSTSAGAQDARERIQQKVKTLCLQLGDELDLSRRATYLECVDKATATANARLDALLHRADNVMTAATR